MNYFYLHIQYLENGTDAVMPLASFKTKDEAMNAYYKQMAYDTDKNNTDVIGTLSKIFERNGAPVLEHFWQRVNELTPEVNE